MTNRLHDLPSQTSGPRRPADWLPPLGTATLFYLLTTPIILIAVTFSFDVVRLSTFHRGSASRTDLTSSFLAWDGRFYAQIVSEGYLFSSDPNTTSNVGFFPVYPLLAAGVTWILPVSAEVALLVVSHLFWWAALVLMTLYLRHREIAHQAPVEWSLLAMAIFPTTFFYRMAYSESVFLFLLVLTCYGMERGWRPIVLALIVGLTTAVRPVGIALLPPFFYYCYRSSGLPSPPVGSDPSGVAHGHRQPGGRATLRFLAQAGALFPVAIWGMVAFMAWQYWAFDEPFAFLEAHRRWAPRNADWQTYGWRLLTAEPIRSVYDPLSACYWGQWPPTNNPFLNLHFANPLYFLFALAVVSLGRRYRWLTHYELLLALGLLLIPYVLHGGRACMVSQARYASAAFPAYIVLGHTLVRLPSPVASALCALSAVVLAFYSALFASWYSFY